MRRWLDQALPKVLHAAPLAHFRQFRPEAPALPRDDVAIGAAALAVNARSSRRVSGDRLRRNRAERAYISNHVLHVLFGQIPGFRHLRRYAVLNQGFQRRIVRRALQMNPVQIWSSPSALSFDSMAHCAVQFEQLLARRGIGHLVLRRMFYRKFGCPILLREPVRLGRTSSAEGHRATKSGESHGKKNCCSDGHGRLLANPMEESIAAGEAYPRVVTLSIDHPPELTKTPRARI